MANMKDPNQGEGDRLAARRYDQHLESFVAQGKPAGAAEDARAWVDAHPNDAAHAERTARRGPSSAALGADRRPRVVPIAGLAVAVDASADAHARRGARY
jgi:hypothetical protein